MSVYEKGNVLANIMILGEAPGREEEEQGVPFVGPSGKLLHALLDYIGLKRDYLFFTNVITDRQKNSRVSEVDKLELIQLGIPRLKRVIRLVKPKLIICFGDTAMIAMKIIINDMPITKSITKMNGEVDTVDVRYMNDKLHILYTLHPASALPSRHPENRKLIAKAIINNKDIIEPITGNIILRGA